MQSDEYIVHIVDDQESVRKSLAFLLGMAGFAVRMHSSATEFLEAAPGIRDGVLVTDLRMPDMSGVELLRHLSAVKVTLPAIVITGHGDVPMAVEAMRAGAVDFIEKPFEEAVIVAAIRRAAEQLVGKPEEAEEVAAIQTRLASLSGRERQVLAGVVAGLANKSIAFDLDISPRTIEIHRANMMAKMRATSLPHLVRMALAAGPAANGSPVV